MALTLYDMPHPSCLTIAGSDSGGGAGLQADIKTFQALGVHGTCVVTALTCQNTLGVYGIYDIPAEVIERQFNAVLSDFNVVYAKTGMLSRAETVRCVSRKVKEYGIRPVIDPVMAAEAGGRLLNPGAVETLKSELLPLAEAVTPNTHEASVLSGIDIKCVEDAKEACKAIRAFGVKNVVITGGHMGGVDVLYDGTFTIFRGKLVKGGTHGTGCTYAAAITACLARGETMKDACKKAKAFVRRAVASSMDVGRGVKPVNPGGVKWQGRI